MKIIMNDVRSDFEAQICFFSVHNAIDHNIKNGRRNFMTFQYNDCAMSVNVVKNKNSYTTYIDREGN